MSNHNNSRERRWLVSAVMAAAAIALFALLYTLDHYITGGDIDVSPEHPGKRFLWFDSSQLTDAVSALAAMIAAVLGIVITVVSIIVQLSADRYTGVARMFIRDPTNQMVMVFYVIACVAAVWLSMSLHEAWVPRSLLIAIMAATTTGLVIMLPYFEYVFGFLEPTNIVDRIRQEAVNNVQRQGPRTLEAYAALQETALKAMEELTDITSNSISGKDKIIASRAVDALKDYCIGYQVAKKRRLDRLAESGANSDDPALQWFLIGERIRDNPDFVAMAPESLADLERRRTWFEWKILRQYMGIYNEALQSMRDITYLIAIDTRYIGERAAVDKDEELIALVFRFMNSYLRSALNAKDVRTAYNVLNQYRLLVETMLRLGYGKFALEGVKRMNYYGKVSYDMMLDFVTITVAYDVSQLCRVAHEVDSSEQDEMLEYFLELDQPSHVQNNKGRVVLGVRKAQVKLAAYYLSVKEEEKARLIAEDMTGEKSEVLVRIRHELEQVTSKDFWEIIDRGRNFEFMPPKERVQMAKFFSWLGVAEPKRPSRPLTSPLGNA